jgi:sphinganine-1-phosphate aldolase
MSVFCTNTWYHNRSLPRKRCKNPSFLHPCVKVFEKKMSETLFELLDQSLSKWKPSKVIFATTATLAISCFGGKLLVAGQLHKRGKAAVLRLVRIVATVVVNREISKAASTIKFKKAEGDLDYKTLPAKCLSHKEVLELAKFRHSGLDFDYSNGACSGMVYHGGEDHTKFINEMMDMFQWSNPLHVDCFGAVRKMEAEIVSMTLSMFHGEAAKSGTACGGLTSGGTESIGMAMRTYREWGRHTRGLTTFSVVAPITIHPAFDKAADYYGMELIKVPIDDSTGIADPEELAKYIRHDTVVICGSAPCFPNGTIDRIADLASVAKRNNTNLHVDCCLGGFIVPFLHDAGFTDAPIVDFRIDGVTSISADTHKYGFAPKGTSVVLYHSAELRRFQYFAIAEWPGGIYASPAAAGSKPGNTIAGTWAAMLAFGRAGYVDTCKQIVSTKCKLVAGLEQIPGVKVLGHPEASVIAFTCTRVDCFELNERLVKKGWMLNPLQFPSGLQFSLTLLQAQQGVADRLLADVKATVTELEAALAPGAVKSPEKGASLYGSQQRIADRTIIADVLRCFLDKYYTVN